MWKGLSVKLFQNRTTIGLAQCASSSLRRKHIWESTRKLTLRDFNTLATTVERSWGHQAPLDNTLEDITKSNYNSFSFPELARLQEYTKPDAWIDFIDFCDSWNRSHLSSPNQIGAVHWLLNHWLQCNMNLGRVHREYLLTMTGCGWVGSGTQHKCFVFQVWIKHIYWWLPTISYCFIPHIWQKKFQQSVCLFLWLGRVANAFPAGWIELCAAKNSPLLRRGDLRCGARLQECRHCQVFAAIVHIVKGL